MNKKKLLMTTPWPKYVEEAKSEGFYLIALWDINDNSNPALNKIVNLVDEFYLINYQDEKKVESLIEWLHQYEPLDYIYHLGKDEHMEMAYRIAQKNNLNLNPLDSIINMNDKYKMRAHLEKHNISSVKYKLFTSIKGIEDNISQFDFPFIIKPTNLSGSKGVMLIDKSEDLLNWKEYIAEYEYSGEYLIEEYLEGKEVSVETISYNGNHYIIGITDKIKTPPPRFIELGHIFPSSLDSNIKSEIEKLVTETLNSFNYKFGPVHTEVIITKDGPKIVELQPRLAGDRIPILIEHATGMSPEKVIMQMLKSQLPRTYETKSISRIHFFQWESGRVSEVIGIEEVRMLESVKNVEINVKKGDIISTLNDSSNRPGYVIASGNSYQELESTIKRIEDMITVIYSN